MQRNYTNFSHFSKRRWSSPSYPNFYTISWSPWKTFSSQKTLTYSQCLINDFRRNRQRGCSFHQLWPPRKIIRCICQTNARVIFGMMDFAVLQINCNFKPLVMLQHLGSSFRSSASATTGDSEVQPLKVDSTATSIAPMHVFKFDVSRVVSFASDNVFKLGDPSRIVLCSMSIDFAFLAVAFRLPSFFFALSLQGECFKHTPGRLIRA